MRVSKRQLKRIIREEKNKLIAETRIRRTIRRALREAGEIPPEGEPNEFETYVSGPLPGMDNEDAYPHDSGQGKNAPKTIDDFPAQMTFSIDIPGLLDKKAGLSGGDVNEIGRAWKMATTKTTGRKKLRNNKHAAEAVSRLVWSIDHSVAINAANEEGIEPPQYAQELAYSKKAIEDIGRLESKGGKVGMNWLLPHIESFDGYKAAELNSIINHPEYDAIVQALQNNVWSPNFAKNPKSKRFS